MELTVPEWVTHPITVASSVTASLTGVLHMDVLLSVGSALIASAPQIFGAVTVATLTLPEFLPMTSAADWLGVLAAALFGVYSLHKINQKFEDRGL